MKYFKHIKYLLALVIFTTISSFSFAQSFNGKAPRVVKVGEQFRLSYTLNAKGGNYKSPDFTNFRVLSGPNVSSSSSVQIVNGNMTKSVNYSYNYILMGTAAGKHTISPATIVVGNKQIKSNAVIVEVVKGASQQNANNNGANSATAAGTKTNGKDIFVAVIVNKKTLYQGESLVAEIKVYTKKTLSGFEDIKLPPFTGFWSQDIEAPTQIQLHRESINGDIYDVGLFKKVLLFPQHSGKITIDPFKITMITQERTRSTNPFDDFFGGSVRRVPFKLASKPITINVKALPSNKPADFNGAVGKYTMKTTVDKTNIKANEAVNINIRISGTGNLKLIKPVKVNFPLDIDVYDPKTSLKTKVSTSGVSGSVTFNYLFIPRYAGTFRIPPITFSYFNTSSKTYKTIKSKEFEIVVERGSGDAEMSSGIVQGLSKEDVKFIGKDIRFLKTDFELERKEKKIFNSWFFYLSYVLSFAIFLLIIILRQAQIKQNTNQSKVKNRKANSVSKKRLKKASRFMKDKEDDKFYDEILRAIWGYLSDKLHIPVSDLSKDNVSEILKERNVDVENIESLTQVLDTCEFARFAPSSVSGGMDDVYKQVVKVISILDNKIK